MREERVVSGPRLRGVERPTKVSEAALAERAVLFLPEMINVLVVLPQEHLEHAVEEGGLAFLEVPPLEVGFLVDLDPAHVFDGTFREGDDGPAEAHCLVLVPEVAEGVVRHLDPPADEVVFEAGLEAKELALAEHGVVDSKVLELVLLEIHVNHGAL